MKYVIEFDLPDNDTVLNNIKTAWVGWNVWGYSGSAQAKPKQPERKKGRWFWTDGMYACDQCHEVLDEKSPFCPMCGADMRGEQNG